MIAASRLVRYREREVLDRGGRLWSYQAPVQGQPDAQLGDRLLQRPDVTGVLSWTVDYWQHSPWRNTNYIDSGCCFSGEGTPVYPSRASSGWLPRCGWPGPAKESTTTATSSCMSYSPTLAAARERPDLVRFRGFRGCRNAAASQSEGVTMKVTARWFSERLQQPITLARWGHYGTPVLMFPTAGGDAEEVERNHLIGACSELIEAGRIKLYSCDSVAGQAMVTSTGSPGYRMWLLNQFHECVASEVVPAIRADLGGHLPPIVATGASIGAFNSLAVMCRYPEAFGTAICMSGTYQVQRFFEGEFSDHLYLSSPVHFLPELDGPQLEALRSRLAILASGEGAWENIGESWQAAEVLGRKGIPNRVDSWGPDFEHDWATWREMLPKYLDEVC